MRLRLRASLLAIPCLVAAFAATPAYAEDCGPDLVDSGGEMWDTNSDGTISDGSSDAYDTFGYASVDVNGDGTFDGYVNPAIAGCTYEDGNREIAYPTDTDAEGIELSRKVYIPSSGLAFGRWLDILHNPGASAVSVDYRFHGNLGLDSDTEVTASSDGDALAEVGDSWVAMDEADFEDTKLTQLWDLPNGADAFDRFGPGGVPGNGEDDVDLIYDDVTIPAGGTVIFVHVDHQSGSRQETIDWGRQHGQGEEDFYAGLSDGERAALRNAPSAPDRDRDGLRDRDDNCISAANADQADMDGDGLGDACDGDMDGDGLNNDQESRIGTDPRKADTDGDGRPDGVDQCPTRPGTDASGCPEAVVVQQPPPARSSRLLAQRVTAEVRHKVTRRGLRIVTRGEVLLPAGLPKADGCRGAVAVQIKNGRRTVSLRRTRLREDCTYRSKVVFTLARRLRRPQMHVQAQFLGNAALIRRSAARTSFATPSL